METNTQEPYLQLFKDSAREVEVNFTKAATLLTKGEEPVYAHLDIILDGPDKDKIELVAITKTRLVILLAKMDESGGLRMEQGTAYSVGGRTVSLHCSSSYTGGFAPDMVVLKDYEGKKLYLGQLPEEFNRRTRITSGELSDALLALAHK